METVIKNTNEKKELINSVMNKLAEFVITDSEISKDYSEYLKTIGGGAAAATTIPYIFERNINSKSILELYLEKSKKLSKEEKQILKGFQKNMSSVFEIKKITKNSFELFNIINEKKYSVLSPIKMTAYRGLGVGYYLVARIFEYDGENYLIEIIGVYSASKKDVAYRYAVSKIVSEPDLVYRDNSEMQKKISKKAAFSYKRFNELFGTDEITTSNRYVDDLIEYLNGSIEELDWKSKIEDVKVEKYFDVSTSAMSNMITGGGFASYSKPFDVTIMVDEKWGFYAIPFYKTFCKLLEGSEIENSKALVEYYLNTSAVTPNILTRLNEKYPGFMDVVNREKGTNMTFEEMLTEYKPEQTFSPTTVLEESEIFSKVVDYISEQEEKTPPVKKVGRNDPCPCGSGKKYKKCCMLKNS